MKRLKMALLSVAFVIIFVNAASACSCIGANSPKEALKKWSSSVFSGEVIAVNDKEFTFKVERLWKGIAAKEIVIFDSMVGTNCSLEMKMGKRYIIFANFLSG